MTTIVAVKKGGMVAIAADSLTTFGDTRLGRDFAPGAMFTAYGKARNAAEIARIGVEAGMKFDTATAGPIVLHTV